MKRSLRRRGAKWIILAMPLLALLYAVISMGQQYRQAELDNALIVAIKERQIARAILLLSQGANANATDNPDRPTTPRALYAEFWRRVWGGPPHRQLGLSALMLACTEAKGERNRNIWKARRADIGIVKALLQHGADPNTFDNGHEITGLDSQIIAGTTPTVKLLLDYHADPNWTIRKSPLSYSVIFSRVDCAELLLRAGADIHVIGKNGMTLMHEAAGLGDDEVAMLSLLYAHHADINARDRSGWTPLICAVESDPNTVRWLLAHGADPTLTDSDGDTALDHAKEVPDAAEKREVVRLLSEADRREVTDSR